MTPDATRGTPHEARSRTELARQLLARVDRIESRLGDISLATEVQLLKREMARGHPVLSRRAEDNNFLSVITLVEGTLANLTWKDYTPKVLDSLRRAFSAGSREGEFSLEEHDAIRRHFRQSAYPTGPRIGLTSPELEEDEDDSQA
jgi:hypothetical protein